MTLKRVFWIFLFVAASVDVDGQTKVKARASCIVNYTYEKGHCETFKGCPTAEKDLKRGFKTTYCKGVDESGRVLVCCRDSSLDEEVVGLKIGDDSTEKPKRISDQKCDEYTKEIKESGNFYTLTVKPVKILNEDALCKFVGMGLILGGQEAKVEEFPHMAAVGYPSTGDKYKFLCTGTLISHRFVMTAAHCNQSTEGMDDVGPPAAIVRLGDINIGPNPANDSTRVDIKIRKIHTHEEYNPPVVYKDIALLELEEKVIFSSSIRPACLWTQDGVGNYVKGFVTGWGITDVLHPQISEVLMKLIVPLQESKFCNKLLESQIGRKWEFGFTPDQMCAGDLTGGHDTCYGDSGGPLQVISRLNKCIYYVLGVTSVGRGCGELDHPSIYTRVSSFLDWIENIVWADGNDD